MDQTDKLLQAYFDDELTPAQEAELLAWLRADPSHVRILVRQAHLHHGIRDILKAEATLRAAVPAKKRLLFSQWRIPLAAAAALLAAAGAFYWAYLRGPSVPEYAMGRLTQATGPLTIADAPSAREWVTTLQTPSNSVCRLDQRDGTVIAVAGQSDLRWSEDRTAGAKTLDLAAGRAYLDVARQQKPFTVRLASGMQAQILGTQMLVNRSESPDSINVLRGRIRVQYGLSALYATAGQTASPFRTLPKTDSRDKIAFLTLAQLPVGLENLSWIDRVGLQAGRILSDVPSRLPASRDRTLDMGKVMVHGGTWEVKEEGGGTTLLQHDPDSGASAALPWMSTWLKGEYSCKVRVLRLSQKPELSPEAGGGFYLVFGFSQNAEQFLGMGRGELARMLTYGSVMNLRAEFETQTGQNSLRVRLMEVWPEGHREAAWKRENWDLNPRTASLDQREPCVLGVGTFGCSAEFFDLSVDNGERGDQPPAKNLRQSLGLIARYNFQGLANRTIPDSSGIAPAMDMTIGKPEFVDRLPAVLRVRGAADIAARGDLPKLRDAWKRNQGLSLELYIRRNESPASNPLAIRRLFRLSAGDGSDSFGHDAPRGPATPDRVYHCVTMWQDRDGVLSQDYYVDGKPTYPTLTGDVPWQLHSRRSPLELCLAPSRDTPRNTTQPWHGELLFAAIYDRALKPEEVTQLHQTGLAPWARGYYTRHGRFILGAERFVDGPVRQIIPPAELLRSLSGEGVSARVVRRTLADKKEGDALSLVNPTMVHCVIQAMITNGLPDAFAVDFEILPIRNILPPGPTKGINLFSLDAVESTVDSLLLADLPTFAHVQELSAPALFLGQWDKVRAEYFRVGSTLKGEPLYEVRFGSPPHLTGTFLSRKPRASVFLSLCGSEVLISELRIRELKRGSQGPH